MSEANPFKECSVILDPTREKSLSQFYHEQDMKP